MPTHPLPLSLLASLVLASLAGADETTSIGAVSAGPRGALLKTATPSEKPAAAKSKTPPADSAPPRSVGVIDTSKRLSVRPTAAAPSPSRERPNGPLQTLMAWRPSSETMTATGAGSAIVVGLLLSFVWLLRSLQPKSARALPSDVVEVLGRARLAGKQTTQLVRVGHKLLLVAVTPDGAETLTEVTDPAEVQAILAACATHNGRGSSAEFDSVLQQLSSERATPGFLDRAADDVGREPLGFADGSFDPRSLAAAYANTPGGRGDG